MKQYRCGIVECKWKRCYLKLQFVCRDGRWYIADPTSQTMLMLNMPVQFYGIAYADMLKTPSPD